MPSPIPDYFSDSPLWNPEQTAALQAGPTNSGVGFAFNAKPYSTRDWQESAIAATAALPTSVKNTVAPAIGRFVTNNVPNFGYGADTRLMWMRDHPIQSLKNFILDRQSKEVQNPFPEYQTASQPLWRQYWGMNPKDTTGVWIRNGRNYTLNPNNPSAQISIQDIQRASQVPYNGISNAPLIGNFIAGHPDTYNFDLHTNEIPPANQSYSTTAWLRQMMEALTGHNAAIVNTNYP